MKNGKQNKDRSKQGQRENKRTNLGRMGKSGNMRKENIDKENRRTGRRADGRREGMTGQARASAKENGVPAIVDRGARNTNAR